MGGKPPRTLIRMPDQFQECQRDLLRIQSGVISRRQAMAGGSTAKAIEVRLRTGRWQRLHPGVYATFTGEPPRSAMLWAAVLRAGTDALLSHRTAAELYGIYDDHGPLIHVTVSSGSQVLRPHGVAIHYSSRLAESRHPVLLPPRTRLEDSVLDLVHESAVVDDALGVVLRAVGRRLTTSGRILAAMRQRPRLRWRNDIAGALGLAAGSHSLLEYRYVTRVEQPHGLPRGVRQKRVGTRGRSQYQDVSYDDYSLVVELDGRAAHPAESRWRDIHRDNANLARGLVTIRFSYGDISDHACQCAATVGEVLVLRGWQGRLRRCGSTCSAVTDSARLPRS
jgi:hypothetical protein